MGLVNWLRL